MLFLLNQELIDLGDPFETLQASGGGEVKALPSLGKLVMLGQDAAFAGHGIEGAHLNIRRTLAAMLAMTGQVNCALFLCPPKARSPREVAVRLGMAPITTMAALALARDAGGLSAALINDQVWRVAGGVAAA